MVNGKLSWPRFIDAARASIAQGVEAWAAEARISGGEVNGTSLFLPPGSLTAEADFSQAVAKSLLESGAPSDVAEAFARAWESWHGWAASYSLFVPDAIPSFGAVAAPEAPETPVEPLQLRDGSAPDRIWMTEESQRAGLSELLARRASDPAARDGIARFARWYASSFDKWFEEAILVNLVAKGPVPSLAPPYVPVGPVVKGFAFGSSVLKAPPFG